MSTFFDFDAWLSDELKEQPTFVMGGETYACKSPSKVSWQRYGGLMTALSAGKVPEGKTEMEQTRDFFDVVLTKDDRKRFQVLLDNDGDDDDGHVASNPAVGRLLQWLLTVYSGVDGPKDEPSSPKPSPSGARSRTKSTPASINPKS